MPHAGRSAPHAVHLEAHSTIRLLLIATFVTQHHVGHSMLHAGCSLAHAVSEGSYASRPVPHDNNWPAVLPAVSTISQSFIAPIQVAQNHMPGAQRHMLLALRHMPSWFWFW